MGKPLIQKFLWVRGFCVPGTPDTPSKYVRKVRELTVEWTDETEDLFGADKSGRFRKQENSPQMFGEMNQVTMQATHYPAHQPQHPMRSVTEAARDRKVCALIMTGRGVQEVAEAFDITVSKVTEILEEYQYDPAIRNLQWNYLEFSRTQALESIAKIQSEPHQETKDETPARKKKSAPVAVKVGNEDIFAALQKAMAAFPSGIALSQQEYNEWRDANDPEAPGTRTIRRRLGWQQAKEMAAAAEGHTAGLEQAGTPDTIGYQKAPDEAGNYLEKDSGKNFENVVDIIR